MERFFKSWKRGFGLFTLIMAAILMAAWLRGRTNFDYVGLHPDQHTEIVFASSRDGLICGNFRFAKPRRPGPKIERFTEFIPSDQTELALDVRDFDDAESHIDWFGFHFIEGKIRPKPDSGQLAVWIFPHLPLASSLTLLSAWLLSKRRTAPQPVVEPTSEAKA